MRTGVQNFDCAHLELITELCPPNISLCYENMKLYIMYCSFVHHIQDVKCTARFPISPMHGGADIWMLMV